MPGAVNLHARLVAVQSSLPDPNILSTQSSQKKKRKKKRKKNKRKEKTAPKKPKNSNQFIRSSASGCHCNEREGR
jgi:hypothetical protein